MEATYFWGLMFFPFSPWGWSDPAAGAFPNGWSVFLQKVKRKRRGVWKKWKKAPCRHLWSVSVTAWSAISSSPTPAASYAAGRQPVRPPAPRTLAAGAGGLCSTWPRPGMTSAGRGRRRGRGGGGTASSRRLRTEKQILTVWICQWGTGRITCWERIVM